MQAPPKMPSTLHKLRQAMKVEEYSITMTPAERIHLGNTFPENAGSRKELRIYTRIREIIEFNKEELFDLPSTLELVRKSDKNFDMVLVFSHEQLDLIIDHLKALEESKKLPNISAIDSVWTKIEGVLGYEEGKEEELYPLDINGET